MSTPLPLPLRVLVKGASTVSSVSYMGGPRSDFAYPRATEAALLEAGQPAEVRDTSMAAEHPKAALRTWEREVVNWSPDVIVLHYGHMESIHLFLPRILQRHAQSFQTRPGRVRDAYRRHFVRPVWKALARLQQRIDRLVPATIFKHRPRRVTADLERLVRNVQTVGSPLVLIMELTPPGTNYATWFPGIGERLEAMNDALAEVVRRVDRPNVRLFRTGEALARLAEGDGPPNPDGGHFTPAAHRVVAATLAEEILAWARQEPHLHAIGDPPRTLTRPEGVDRPRRASSHSGADADRRRAVPDGAPSPTAGER